jgi:dynein heavy chain
MEYGYECLGATTRLVVTSLTERCYLTLISALHSSLGESPAEPAGTGKTETVKDLSKAVGNFCVVFNCSDAVTFIQMESFFSGLAQAVTWASFDEINRINSQVLVIMILECEHSNQFLSWWVLQNAVFQIFLEIRYVFEQCLIQTFQNL